MQLRKRHTARARITGPLPLILLGLAMLSGCVGDAGPPARFQEALDAPGPTFPPDRQEGDTAFRVKILQPADPNQAKWGVHDLVLVIYDEASQRPIEDASVSLESWMTEHGGHGTSGEKDPTHEEHGIYRGTTAHMNEGEWEVRLEGTRAGGDKFWLAMEFNVA